MFYPSKKLGKKHLYVILILCSIIILSVSVNTLARAKNYDLYESWKNNLDLQNVPLMDISFQGYLGENLVYLFSKIIIPLFLSLNTYFAYTRTGISKLFIIVWTFLVLAALIGTVLEFAYYSIFYYVNIILYIALFFTILSLLTKKKN